VRYGTGLELEISEDSIVIVVPVEIIEAIWLVSPFGSLSMAVMGLETGDQIFED